MACTFLHFGQCFVFYLSSLFLISSNIQETPNAILQLIWVCKLISLFAVVTSDWLYYEGVYCLTYCKLNVKVIREISGRLWCLRQGGPIYERIYCCLVYIYIYIVYIYTIYSDVNFFFIPVKKCLGIVSCFCACVDTFKSSLSSSFEGYPLQVRHKQDWAEGLFFYYPRLLHCLNQMLAVVLLSQHRVLSSKTVRPRSPCGARCIGHAVSTWSAVCSEAPHSQFGEIARPHLCMDEWNRPTPVRRWLSLI